MFKLVVMLFLVTNGVVAEQPVGKFTNKTQFETEKACMEFLSTEAGKKSKLLIEELIDEKKGQMEVKFICVTNGALKEDDSI